MRAGRSRSSSPVTAAPSPFRGGFATTASGALGLSRQKRFRRFRIDAETPRGFRMRLTGHDLTRHRPEPSRGRARTRVEVEDASAADAVDEVVVHLLGDLGIGLQKSQWADCRAVHVELFDAAKHGGFRAAQHVPAVTVEADGKAVAKS